MRVLIAGEYGFFGCKMAERLEKEGHTVIILSAHGGPTAGKFYQLPYDDVKCEEIFRISNLDAVIYDNFAAGSAAESSFLSGLTNLFTQSAAFGVTRFVNVVRRDGIALDGASPALLAGLSYLRAAAALSAVKPVSVCLDNLYGSGRSAGLVYEWLTQSAEAGLTLIKGEAAQQCAFTHINDAVDGVYRALTAAEASELYNFADDKAALGDIAAAITAVSGNPVTFRPQPPQPKQPDFSGCALAAGSELGWSARYKLTDGSELKVLLEQRTAELAAAEAELTARPRWWRRFSASLENAALFCLLAAWTVYVNGISTVNISLGLDYGYIYIAIMGLLYGKQQSIPATVASIVLLTYAMMARGADFVGLLYQSSHIVHLASYLFVGVFTGYIADNHQRLLEDVSKETANLLERYEFLRERYLETVNFKDRLYRQIINSDDSIGRVYKIISRLSDIEPEGVFTAANQIAGEIMETKSVAIYVCGRSPYFLRLKTHSGNTDELPRSLRIEQFDYLNEVINNKRIYVNRALEMDAPDMAVPIISDDKIIAVVQLYELPFENFDRQHESLFNVTAMLIADALGRAYRYEAEVQDKRCLDGTRFLKASEFYNIWNMLRRRNTVEPLLLRFDGEQSPAKLSEALEKIVREEDYLGQGSDGQLYMLLEDVDENIIAIVRNRISSAGIATTLVREARKCLTT